MFPWDWRGMMGNNECFNHGADVNTSIGNLLVVGQHSAFNFRGMLSHIKGTKITMKPSYVKVK